MGSSWKLYFYIVLSLCTKNMFAQNGLTLSREQMYADFDTLVAIITTTSPQLKIKKDLWHYDGADLMTRLRKNIDTISTDFSYYLVLRKALNLNQDMHTSLLENQAGWAAIQQSALKRTISAFKFSIANIYANGSYWVTDPIILNGDTIPIATEIISINNQPISNYLKNNFDNEVYQYDIAKKQFYYAGFFKNLATCFQDSIKITLKTEKGSAKEYQVPTTRFTRYLPDIGIKNKDTTRVEYWGLEKVLYIRLTEMNPANIPFIKQNIAKHAPKPIGKIIIDIRGNQGGQDRTWQSLYAELIADTITYSMKIDDNENGRITRQFVEAHGVKVDAPFKTDTFPLLKKYHFRTLVSTKETIEPSPTSIKFKGKIYLLTEDVYSSAGSAVSVASANKTDNLVSVGRKTGYFLGIGFSPLSFELPNTRLKFRVAPSIEVSNADSLSELMQDKIEIEIPYSLQYYKDKYFFEGNSASEEFMVKYDPFIKKVLGLK